MSNIKTGDRIQGFIVDEIRPLTEIDATMIHMTYEKNKAELIWLDRADENKTFAITFKTIPQDDTGVFHILEHSVLCGSDKYPVKEPFVDLLKSSLQTFLNALTFPDKTMYPLSSRNDKDFLNLIDVYMDAVLHPLSIHDPHAFRQEGWHYELEDADSELICNGVVYNEMKGAFASPDDLLQSKLNALLFPDNCYGCESGGDPDHITELTYENYLANHRRFYHPSNSRIFLDGEVDLDPVLAKISSFLEEYDYLEVDSDIPMQQPVEPEAAEYPYEVSDDGADKYLLGEGWVYGTFVDREKTFALRVLTEVLTDSNEAPLTKAILDKGIAMDVEFQPLDGIMQPYLALVLRNVSEEKRATAFADVREIFEDIINTGLDSKRINAALNRLEFLTRERDYGTMPRGLVNAIDIMEGWLYGGDPANGLTVNDIFISLCDKIGTGYYEEVLKECILDNHHHARITLIPSQTLGAEKQEREAERLRNIRAEWSDEETASVIDWFGAFREKQAKPDSPEDLAKLPTLSLEDVPAEIKTIPMDKLEVGGVSVLHPHVNTNGIIYLDLYFDLSDLTVEELKNAKFMARMLGDVATTNYDVNSLQSEIDSNLGRLSANVTAIGPAGSVSEATPYLKVNVALLEDKKAEAVRLIREVLRESLFDNKEFLFNELRQMRISLEQSIVQGGNSYARQRVAAHFSVLGMLTEALYGIDILRWAQNVENEFDNSGDEFIAGLSALFTKLLSRERVIVGVTGPLDEAWIGDVLDVLTSEPAGEKVEYAVDKNAPMREGYQIPAAISFTASGSNLYALGEEYSGYDSVAAQILTFGFLWNTIRVQGGAYGTGLRIALNGDVLFSSFRDPSGGQSLDSYGLAAASLRELAASGDSLDNYIISTVGGLEPLLTPRMEGNKAILNYFLGVTDDDVKRVRSEVLETTPADLNKVADSLDKIMESAAVCVIGGEEILKTCELDSVEILQKN